MPRIVRHDFIYLFRMSLLSSLIVNMRHEHIYGSLPAEILRCDDVFFVLICVEVSMRVMSIELTEVTVHLGETLVSCNVDEKLTR